MRGSNKHDNIKRASFGDFTGGVNLAISSEYIAVNELADAVNVEYENNGTLRTRGGIGRPKLTLDSNIAGMWYSNRLECLLIAAGQYLYAHNKDITKRIGMLSGNNSPCFCDFDDKVFIASGGKLQYVDGIRLYSVNSPFCSFVYERFGRLVITNNGSDNLYYSSVGDASSNEAWVDDSNDVSSSKWLEIGYKDGMDIVSVIPLAQDLIVFKGGKVYRVSSEYPDWLVNEIASDVHLANMNCVVRVGGNIFFLDKYKGMQELSAVQEYGDFRAGSIMAKIEPWVIGNVDAENSRVWHLKNRKQVIIKRNNSNDVAVYSYMFGATTFWRFDKPVLDFACNEKGVVYVAQKNNVYIMSDDNSADNLVMINTRLVTRSYKNENVIKRIKAYFDSKNNCLVNIKSNKLKTSFRAFSRANMLNNANYIVSSASNPVVDEYDRVSSEQVYGNTALVFGNTNKIYVRTNDSFSKHQLHRNDNMQFVISSDNGALWLKRFDVEFVDVGVGS